MDKKIILDDIRSSRRKKVIIDTDAYNEIDDQYAIAYQLGSKNRIEVLSINAAPFCNEKTNDYAYGMERSYDEIHKVLSLTDNEGIKVYKGSEKRISDEKKAQVSPAAENIINTVMGSDELVYIVAQGALTNISSAVMIEPDICDRICVIWLGMNEKNADDHHEFNYQQDPLAAKYLFDGGTNVLLCPAIDVTARLLSNMKFTEELRGTSKIGDYLYKITEQCFLKAGSPAGWVRTIWDIAAPAILIVPDCADISVEKAPVLGEDVGKLGEYDDKDILYLNSIDKNMVFEDVLRVISDI